MVIPNSILYPCVHLHFRSVLLLLLFAFLVILYVIYRPHILIVKRHERNVQSPANSYHKLDAGFPSAVDNRRAFGIRVEAELLRELQSSNAIAVSFYQKRTACKKHLIPCHVELARELVCVSSSGKPRSMG